MEHLPSEQTVSNETQTSNRPDPIEVVPQQLHAVAAPEIEHHLRLERPLDAPVKLGSGQATDERVVDRGAFGASRDEPVPVASGLLYDEAVEFEPRFSEAEIDAAVASVAAEISRDYSGKTPLLVGVLKGSFVFLADLVRALSIPCEVDFIRARSYGAGLTSSGFVEITNELESDVAGRDVVVVEDIADTGLTMRAVVEHVQAARPASIRCCSLLVREGCDEPDYAGLRVGPGFVLGYGIDFAEGYRGLRDIRALATTVEHPD